MYETNLKEAVSLRDVLTYRHPGVIRRYCLDHHATEKEAEELFREMLKWLYLCYRNAADHPDGAPCALYSEIEKIDWMWHTFLLFTRDYADFCHEHFGFFIHHVPNVERDDEAALPADDDHAFWDEVERQYALVYSVLGMKTLLRWYDEQRYAVPKPVPERRRVRRANRLPKRRRSPR
jgi:hypothetical protein